MPEEAKASVHRGHRGNTHVPSCTMFGPYPPTQCVPSARPACSSSKQQAMSGHTCRRNVVGNGADPYSPTHARAGSFAGACRGPGSVPGACRRKAAMARVASLTALKTPLNAAGGSRCNGIALEGRVQGVHGPRAKHRHGAARLGKSSSVWEASAAASTIFGASLVRAPPCTVGHSSNACACGWRPSAGCN